MATQVHQQISGSQGAQLCGRLQHHGDLFDDDEDAGLDPSKYRDSDAFACDRLLARLMMFHPERTRTMKLTNPVLVVPDPAPAPPLSEPIASPASRAGEWGSSITINEVADEPYVPVVKFLPDPVVTLTRCAARYFNLPLPGLLSVRRDACIVRARQIAMFLSREITGRPLERIGRRFGGRDHTTVLHAVRKIGTRIRTDQWLAYDVAAIHALAIKADPSLA